MIIATKYDPEAVLTTMLPLLRIGGYFAIYYPTSEPLTKPFWNLKQNANFVNIQLSEVWFREYQVLPERTHPTMQMSGSGGYILSGIKVLTLEN